MSISQRAVRSSRPHPIQKRATLAAVALLVGLTMLAGTVAPATLSVFSATAISSVRPIPRADLITAAREWLVAVNLYLETGVPAAIERATADDFIERSPWPGISPNREGLLRSLDALKTQLPELRLNPTILGVSDSIVTLNVEASTGEPAHEASFVNGQTESWNWLEHLRIIDGRVVERWGPQLPVGLTLQQTTLQTDQLANFKAARVVRLTLDPGLVFAGRESLIVVESGELRFNANDGLFLAATGETSIGAPNLVDQAVATAGDIVYAKYQAHFEVMSPARVLVADSASKSELDETAFENQGDVGIGPWAGLIASSGSVDSELYHQLLPLNPLAMDGEVTMEPFFDWGERNGVEIALLNWQSLSIPAGTLLPSVGVGELAIVCVDEGEIVSDFVAQPTTSGEHFVNYGGEEFTLSVATQPTAVRILRFELVR